MVSFVYDSAIFILIYSKAFGVANLMSSVLTPVSIVMTGFIMERSVLLPFQLFAGGLGLCFILTFSVKEAREAK